MFHVQAGAIMLLFQCLTLTRFINDFIIQFDLNNQSLFINYST